MPEKKQDDSLFEDVPYSGPDDSLFEDVSHPEAESTNQSDTLDVSSPAFNSTATGTLIGHEAGKGISALTEKGLDKLDKAAVTVASKFSDYTPEQIARIKGNYPEYAGLKPDQAFSNLQSRGTQTNELINQLQKEAYQQLDKKTLPPSQYQSIVENTLKEPLRTSKLPSARDLSQETLQSIEEGAREQTQEFAQNEKERMLREFSELKAQEAIKTAQQQNLGPLPVDTEQNIYKQVKQDALDNPSKYDYTPNIKQEDLTNKLNEFRTSRIREQNPRMSNLLEKYPSLEGKTMAPTVVSDVEKMLGITAPGADVTGSELYQIDRDLAGRGFNADGQITSEYPAAASKSIRKDVAKISPEASTKFSQMSPEIKKLEGLEEAGYITRGKDIHSPDFVTVEQKNVDKLIKDMVSGTDTDKRNAEKGLAKLKEFLSPEEFDKLTFSALKQAETGAISVPGPRISSAVNTLTRDVFKNKGSRMLATVPEMMAHNLPRVNTAIKGAIKYAPKIAGAFAGGAIGMAAQAAEEGLDSEASGANPNMPDYWLEKGVRDPEEQLQRSRLSDFKENLTTGVGYDPQPSAYNKPELRSYKEKVIQAEKQGQNLPNYVEKYKSPDDLQRLQDLHNKFQSMTGKGAEAATSTLAKALNGSEEEKSQADFIIQQTPSLRSKLKA